MGSSLTPLGSCLLVYKLGVTSLWEDNTLNCWQRLIPYHSSPPTPSFLPLLPFCWTPGLSTFTWCAEKNYHDRPNCSTLKGLLRWTLGCQPETWILGLPITLTGKSGSACLSCAYKQCGLCWMSAFHLGVWEFGLCEAHGVPTRPTPTESFWHWVCNELPSRPCFSRILMTHHWRLKLLLWDSTGRGLSEACSWFPCTRLHVPFALNVSFCYNKS